MNHTTKSLCPQLFLWHFLAVLSLPTLALLGQPVDSQAGWLTCPPQLAGPSTMASHPRWLTTGDWAPNMSCTANCPTARKRFSGKRRRAGCKKVANSVCGSIIGSLPIARFCGMLFTTPSSACFGCLHSQAYRIGRSLSSPTHLWVITNPDTLCATQEYATMFLDEPRAVILAWQRQHLRLQLCNTRNHPLHLPHRRQRPRAWHLA